MQKPRAIHHHPPIRPYAMQQQHRALPLDACDKPAMNQSPRSIGKQHRLRGKVGRRRTDGTLRRRDQHRAGKPDAGKRDKRQQRQQEKPLGQT